MIINMNYSRSMVRSSCIRYRDGGNRDKYNKGVDKSRESMSRVDKGRRSE